MSVQSVSAAVAKVDPIGFAPFQGMRLPAASTPMAVSSLQRKAPGEILFAEGDETDSVYEVVRGMVRLYKLLADGRRQIMDFVPTGHLLGLAPDGLCVYTAEAITEVTVCRYKRAAFDRLIDEVPSFAKRLLAVASQEIRAAQDQMLLLGRKSATEKVASFLMLMAERQGCEEGDAVEIPMTRADIADYLGLTIETVSRTLSRLKQDGLIAIPMPTHITLCDWDGLGELAAGEGRTEF